MLNPSALFGLLAVSAAPVAATVVEANALPLFQGSCQPSCTARHDGDEPFTLSYKSYKKDSETYIDLRIGDSVFTELDVVSWLIEDGSPPFYKYVFPRHTMYALISIRSAYNSYKHYFARRSNSFDYLGLFPNLHYDTVLNRFVSFERVGRERIKFYYKFEGSRLVEDEDF